MKYDFTTFLDRQGRDSIAADKIPFENAAVEEGFSRIPMWVADMSFPAGPFVADAIRRRLEMPSFGYFEPPEEYYERIIRWHRERKGVLDLTKEAIGYENGVLGGVRSAVCAFSTPGDPILVHSPVYVGFTGTLNGLGRKMVFSELKEKAMEVYAANDCIVISDEIWSDIIMPGHTHIPTQSVSEDAKMRTVAFYAPSKTFSLAGLVGSYHVIYDPLLRDRVRAEGHATRYNEMNVLSMHALMGAYSEEGSVWTDEMISVIDGNLRYACSFIEENFPGVQVMLPQGTYMLYLDCTAWCEEHGVPIDELQRRGVRKGVIWQNGEAFFRKNTIRMNLALPFSMEEEAFRRLKEFVFV